MAKEERLRFSLKQAMVYGKYWRNKISPGVTRINKKAYKNNKKGYSF